jgi:hypothetical protein
MIQKINSSTLTKIANVTMQVMDTVTGYSFSRSYAIAPTAIKNMKNNMHREYAESHFYHNSTVVLSGGSK